jgi:hypothetical protein
MGLRRRYAMRRTAGSGSWLPSVSNVGMDRRPVRVDGSDSRPLYQAVTDTAINAACVDSVTSSARGLSRRWRAGFQRSPAWRQRPNNGTNRALLRNF